MSWRLIAALVALASGLALLLYLSEVEPVEREGPLTDPVLDGRQLGDAREIRIRREPSAPWIEIVRDVDGQFRVEEPVRDLASESCLTEIAGAYDTAQLLPAYEGVEITDKVLLDTGLAEPRAAIEVGWDDGHRVVLELGSTGAFGHDLFARKNGRIYRVQMALHSSLQRNPDDFREPFVFRNTQQQVTGLTIDRRTDSGGREVIRLERTGSRPYRMIEPKDVRIDQGVVNRLVAGVASLRAERFLTGTGGSVGPESLPDILVELDGMAGRETAKLRLLPGDTMIGEVSPRGITFSCAWTRYQSLFEVPMQALRAYWLLPFPLDDAQEITLDPGAGRGPALKLARRDLGEFELSQPIACRANPTPVSELLQGFKSLAVLEFVEDSAADLAPYGLRDGYFTVRVEGRGQTEVIHLGADDEAAGTTYARRADEPHVVSIPRAVADRLRRGWIDYVGLQVMSIDNWAYVRELHFRDGDASTVYQRGADGAWRRADGAQLPASFDDVVDLLRGLDAERALTAEAAGELGAPITVELKAENGDVLRRLSLYLGADDRVLAKHQERDLLYLLKARDGRDLLELR